MRNLPFACALLLALLVAAPLALAGGEAHAEKGRTKAAEARAEHPGKADETADEGPRPGRAAGKDDAEERKAAADGVRARVKTLREALHADATGVREACHGAERDDNATKEGRLAWAHCIRDGYHKLFEAFKLERKSLWSSWRATHA